MGYLLKGHKPMRNLIRLATLIIILACLCSLPAIGQETGAEVPDKPAAAGEPGDAEEAGPEALEDADIVIGMEPAGEEEASAVEVPLPSQVTVGDLPNDDGTAVYLTWDAFPQETSDVTYTVYLAESRDGPWFEAVSFPANEEYMEEYGHYFPGFFWFQKARHPKSRHVVIVEDVRIGEFNRTGEEIMLPEPVGFTIEPNVGPKNEDGEPIEPGVIDELTGEEVVSQKFVEVEPRKVGTMFLKLTSTVNGETATYPEILEVGARQNWFDTGRLNVLIFAVLFGATVLYFIARARRDPDLFIRKISGLDAVDEAIGRATEMGKPILYLNGMSSLADLPTLAALNILGRVARRVANYESKLTVPCRDPIVLTVAQEIVKAGYADAGRPDAYNADDIFFLTEDQFSYAAAVCGIMMRDKPAANFFMGYYYAESLILAETGASTGAIQIAGTDAPTQLPFFVTTCDYTLIGEELYAASAYLSREPLVLGSLKGQDMAKVFMMFMIVVGTLLMTFGVNFVKDLFKALG